MRFSATATRIHSVRLPSFVVSTEIVFGGPGERLVIRHDPGLGADPYVAGTLLAIRKVADAPGLRRGLDSLLFNEAQLKHIFESRSRHCRLAY
jgi:4-hydroxy-tetrahydrodipicolinate reductase